MSSSHVVQLHLSLSRMEDDEVAPLGTNVDVAGDVEGGQHQPEQPKEPAAKVDKRRKYGKQPPGEHEKEKARSKAGWRAPKKRGRAQQIEKVMKDDDSVH